MSKKPEDLRLPVAQRSVQYDLFSQFYGDGDYSNTADLWDAVPKSCVTARKQVAMRDEGGRLPILNGYKDIAMLIIAIFIAQL